ncbi:hypothetical protein [Croceicoccus sp. Ery5]|uniref:hypothetical protein n=1 Tax=Croceicoccus sp. Ery5 TaxID=1703340 RepID=UPI001E5830A5|nr:hypothetical protein [Croceicoccus sp. Ery5]
MSIFYTAVKAKTWPQLAKIRDFLNECGLRYDELSRRSRALPRMLQRTTGRRAFYMTEKRNLPLAGQGDSPSLSRQPN